MFLKAWLSGKVGDCDVGVPTNYIPQGRGEVLSLISGCRILEIGIGLFSKNKICLKNIDSSEQSRGQLTILKAGEIFDATQALNTIKTMVS